MEKKIECEWTNEFEIEIENFINNVFNIFFNYPTLFEKGSKLKDRLRDTSFPRSLYNRSLLMHGYRYLDANFNYTHTSQTRLYQDYYHYACTRY